MKAEDMKKDILQARPPTACNGSLNVEQGIAKRSSWEQLRPRLVP